MLNEASRQRAADLLIEAERTGVPTTQLDQAFPGIEIDDAYAIQQRIIAAKLAAGARLRGHKIGLTSKAMQSTVGINEPDYGHLLDTMFFQDGDTIATDTLIVPRVEVELAFVLGKPLKGPDVTLFDVLDATDYVVPALELIDGRSKYPRRIVDNIADNAACAGIILGGRPVRPLDVDLRWVGALLLKNGVIEESGVSAAVLGHPAMGIVWLANKLAQHDTGLQAGHVVLAGSFTRTVAVAKGDTIHADYGPLGSISVHFS
ncbi:2-oxo-hept-4-ene-1,7-dioate hydratase [Achromobacter deleyi]|uniref:2-oxo-hept-4-ene-1,7-dioate hydratase n=1 Tax=Achromobacter deleyi TaxID=1353891 RepID=A0A6S7AHU2_9BURK|nr:MULTISPECIES: 2-oxo-hepta-3-ene-1,7-dioic acid hydratase [Achromobacter]CAB3727966.1 2-oxo-hept-4-ene-1,7-dioate hydratase [Achromobacter deleyi]CAB3884917.1 2-oxo-hept-4-ene-1,7-dioate hydratase [Achromobacter deleyi]CAB3918534.1 2-oxo-hept-4-ene-1,7-dioate hydratase [Achromobacter deleyi]CAB3919607.1 2-oxo-hept-4-ene-1,7-dioate hydratase [Achromobacter deleyi]